MVAHMAFARGARRRPGHCAAEGGEARGAGDASGRDWRSGRRTAERFRTSFSVRDRPIRMCIRADLAGRLAPTCARRRARFRRRQTASPITRRSYVVVASTAPRFGFTFAPPGATPRPQRRPMEGAGRTGRVVVKWSYTGSDVKVAHTVSTDARHARAGCWPRRAPRQGAAAGAVLRPSPFGPRARRRPPDAPPTQHTISGLTPVGCTSRPHGARGILAAPVYRTTRSPCARLPLPVPADRQTPDHAHPTRSCDARHARHRSQ